MFFLNLIAKYEIMNSLSVQILSVPYREKLIAEIQFKNHVIAEISQAAFYLFFFELPLLK